MPILTNIILKAKLAFFYRKIQVLLPNYFFTVVWSTVNDIFSISFLEKFQQLILSSFSSFSEENITDPKNFLALHKKATYQAVQTIPPCALC